MKPLKSLIAAVTIVTLALIVVNLAFLIVRVALEFIDRGLAGAWNELSSWWWFDRWWANGYSYYCYWQSHGMVVRGHIVVLLGGVAWVWPLIHRDKKFWKTFDSRDI